MITPYKYRSHILAFIKYYYPQGCPRGLFKKADTLYQRYDNLVKRGKLHQMHRVGVAAACVYVGAGHKNIHIKQTELAKYFEISEPTLRKAARILEENVVKKEDYEW